MEGLADAENVGLYIKLENAKVNYYHTMGKTSEDKYDELLTEINELISSPKADESFKLNAHIEIILIKGSKNNWDNVKQTALINATEIVTGPDMTMRRIAMDTFLQTNFNWHKEVTALKEDVLKTKSQFHYFNLLLNEVKVLYETQVLIRLIKIEHPLPGDKVYEMPDVKPYIHELTDKVDKALLYFRNVGHIENQIVAQSIKYELYHYNEDFAHADKALSEAEMLAESFELADKKRRAEYLRNGGTTHELCKASKENILGNPQAKQQEYEELVAEMMEMDEAEECQPPKNKGHLTVELFPIGYFQFPEQYKETVYEILNIRQQTVRDVFNQIFKVAIPVANIHHEEIMQEGYVNGKLADHGIESWRNIHRVRKAFHEKKFYRVEVKCGK